MAEQNFRPRSVDWNLTGEDTRGQSGSIRVKLLGARGGVACAELEVWAVSADDLVTFLRGVTETIEGKYGRIVTPAGSRN